MVTRIFIHIHCAGVQIIYNIYIIAYIYTQISRYYSALEFGKYQIRFDAFHNNSHNNIVYIEIIYYTNMHIRCAQFIILTFNCLSRINVYDAQKRNYVIPNGWREQTYHSSW